MVTTRTVQYEDLLQARDNTCRAERFFKSLALQLAPCESSSLEGLYRDPSDRMTSYRSALRSTAIRVPRPSSPGSHQIDPPCASMI
jgi:hypothetical protein